MIRAPRLPRSIRPVLAVVLALCLGVRLLTPAGFMPSFAGGSLAIVPCPDAEGAPPAPPPMPDMPGMDLAGMDMPGMAMPAPGHDHDHGKDAFHHPSCPYAAAASIAGLDLGGAALVFLILLASSPPLARTLPRFCRRATRDRPPAQGPPLAA